MQPATTTYAARRTSSSASTSFCNRLWHVMRERYPHFQLILYDEENERPLGRGATMWTRCALPRPPASSTA